MPTLSRWRTGHAQPADIQKQNERSVLIDGLGVGIVTCVSTFLSVFLTRLGASPFLVGRTAHRTPRADRHAPRHSCRAVP